MHDACSPFPVVRGTRVSVSVRERPVVRGLKLVRMDVTAVLLVGVCNWKV